MTSPYAPRTNRPARRPVWLPCSMATRPLTMV
jgi:hypothetical protein